MPVQIKRYGWKPQLPDHRDRKWALTDKVTPTPSVVDLRDKMPVVYDQGELGSCTANAIAAAFEFELARQELSVFTPSRLFIYYNERVMEGDPDQDNGAQIRDGFKSIANQGVCPETDWPYDISGFWRRPSDKCYSEALDNKAIQYLSLPNDLLTQKIILAGGTPFVLGISVFESFESEVVAQTGIVPMPGPNESMVGGHAILAVGYDDSKQSFLMRNSWGTSWGLAGYFYLPYGYVQTLGSDFWSFRIVS